MSALFSAVLPNPFLMTAPGGARKPVKRASKPVGTRAAKGTGKPSTGARKRGKGGAK